MTDNTQTQLTNKAVAARLGLSESGVSRLRSGDRLPSLALMQRVQAEYAWSVQDQSDARAAGKWTETFEKAILTPA